MFKLLNSTDAAVIIAKINRKADKSATKYLSYQSEKSKELQALANTHLNRDAQILLNNHRIEIPEDLDDSANNLAKWLVVSNWSALDVVDPTMIQVALKLFTEGRISRLQYETLTSRHQASTRHPTLDQKIRYPLRTYKILTDQGEFTPEALQHLIPNLDGYMHQTFDETKLENFRLLMQELIKDSPSENSFFTVKIHRVEMMLDSMAGTLNVDDLAAIIFDINDQATKIVLSASARLATRIACFGTDVMLGRSMIGKVSIEDIEMSIRCGFRIKAAAYPGIKGNPDIHGLTDMPLETISDHDEYHIISMSKPGKKVRQMFLSSANAIRKKLLTEVPRFSTLPCNKLNSLSHWDFIDAEFKHFANREFKTPCNDKEIGAAYCKALSVASEEGKVLYFDEKNRITDVGITGLIDMLIAPDNWPKNLAVTEILIDDFLLHMNRLKKLESFLSVEDSRYNVLLYRCSLEIPAEYFATWQQSFHANYEQFKYHFVCERNNLESYLGFMEKYTLNKPLKNFAQFVQSICDDEKIDMQFKLINLALLVSQHVSVDSSSYRTAQLLFASTQDSIVTHEKITVFLENLTAKPDSSHYTNAKNYSIVMKCVGLIRENFLSMTMTMPTQASQN